MEVVDQTGGTGWLRTGGPWFLIGVLIYAADCTGACWLVRRHEIREVARRAASEFTTAGSTWLCQAPELDDALRCRSPTSLLTRACALRWGLPKALYGMPQNIFAAPSVEVVGDLSTESRGAALDYACCVPTVAVTSE